MPDNVPIPQPRPDVSVKDGEPEPVEEKAPGTKTAPEKVEAPAPVEKEDPQQLAACLVELKALGVKFSEQPPIVDGNGCGIDHPLNITALGNSILLKPEATMRCGTALELARWTHEVAAPMLKKAMPDEEITQVDQASAYICRKRNNAETGKISEHARGNAVDISGFTFKSGKTYNIEPRMQDSTLKGAFQRAITSAACLYFSTVLDPTSDKAHETHLHLDIMQRNGDFRYCW